MFEEALRLQSGSTPLHSFKAVYLKLAIVLFATISRFAHPHAVPVALVINVVILVCVGATRIMLAVLAAWSALALVVCLLDLAFSTFTLNVILNLVYGFTTFTSLALFYVTTPPRHLRKLVGLNAVSLTYLLLGYSINLVRDLLDILRARGWSYSAKPTLYVYPLRALAALMINRVAEVEETLKARGVEG